MNANLRIDQTFSKELTAYSTSIRHGNPIPLELEDRMEIIRRAWAVADRYILFVRDPSVLAALPLLVCDSHRVCLDQSGKHRRQPAGVP
jgi:hypothetical protein